MESNFVSDSSGQTPAKSVDRRSKTTRLYGVNFLKGKVKDNDIQALCESKRIDYSSEDFTVCCFVTVATIFVTLGLSFALVGHFMPKETLLTSPSFNGTKLQSNIHAILKFNHMLETFVLSGMVLMAIGIIMFVLIIATSLCYTYEVNIPRSKGYTLASNSDVEELMLLGKASGDDQVASGNTEESPAGQFSTIHINLKPVE